MNDIQDENGPARWDPTNYGKQFADRYDQQHGLRGDEAALVTALGSTRPNGNLLELGIGTGRLAIPLQQAGWRVVGLDASDAMVDPLRHTGIPVWIGDAANPATYPPGPFDVVLAAFNFICNLPGPTQLAAMFEACASVSHPDTDLWVETQILDEVDEEFEIGATFSTDEPAGGSVTSTMIDRYHSPNGSSCAFECVRTEPSGHRRVWYVTVTTLSWIDHLASAAGWHPTDRWSSWSGTPWQPGDAVTVTRYLRFTNPTP